MEATIPPYSYPRSYRYVQCAYHRRRERGEQMLRYLGLLYHTMGNRGLSCPSFKCSILLNASQAIPLFVTSLVVPLLLVTLQVIRAPTEEPGVFEHLQPKDATGYVSTPKLVFNVMLTMNQLRILYHVFSHHHASHRWFHDIFGAE